MPAECLTSTCLDCLTVRHWLHRLISGKSPIWPEHCSHNLDMLLSPEKKTFFLRHSVEKHQKSGIIRRSNHHLVMYRKPLVNCLSKSVQDFGKPSTASPDQLGSSVGEEPSKAMAAYCRSNYRSAQLAMNKGATYSVYHSVFLQQSPAYLLKLSELTLLIKEDHNVVESIEQLQVKHFVCQFDTVSATFANKAKRRNLKKSFISPRKSCLERLCWTPNGIQMHRCINCFFSLPEASHARLVRVLLTRIVLIEMFIIHCLYHLPSNPLQFFCKFMVLLSSLHTNFPGTLAESCPPTGSAFAFSNCQVPVFHFPPPLSMEPPAGPYLL